MKRTLTFATTLILAAAAPAAAQSSDPACMGSGSVQDLATSDACQKAVDLYRYLAPQLATVIAGGNFTPGQGGSLGGLGHFSLALRANAIQASIPQVDQMTISPTGPDNSSTIPTKTQIIGLPAVDVALGLFKGLPLGLTNIGGIDLLLSGMYVPKVSQSSVTIDPQSTFKLGYGARIGLLQESLVVPGIGFSIMRRDLPTINLTGDVGGASSATLNVQNLAVKTTGWRLTASKNLMLFSIGAGVGQDRYEFGGTISGTYQGASSQTVTVNEKRTKTTYFANAGMNFMVGKLVAEIGQVSGGTSAMYNNFQDAPDKTRLFGSASLRFGF